MAQINKYFYLLVLCLPYTMYGQSTASKCGTYRSFQQVTYSRSSNSAMASVIRPVMQKNVLTENGKIRLHYDTSGIHQPAMVSVTIVNGVKTITKIPNSYAQFIDTVKKILNVVWQVEIDQFGFEAPPSDGTRGGGGELDFYVEDLSGGLFGRTNIETDIPVGPTKANQQFASFIEIDNDFGTGYRTNGIEAVMATTAHEFHHAVQIGGSGVWEDEQFYFYELCAEAMENTVFRDAKDYIFDVKTYYKNIFSIPLFQLNNGTIDGAGYERAVWGMFLMKKYSPSIMKGIWNEMKLHRPILAQQNTLNMFSTSIQREFVDFTFWNFYTGYRADSVKYFTDAKIFPTVSLYQTIPVSDGSQTIQINTKSFAPYYIKATSLIDSAFFIISNTDYSDALNNSQQNFASQLIVTTSSIPGYPAISSSIFAKFTSTDQQNWSYNPIGSITQTVCFPNPFTPSMSSLLISLLGVGTGNDVTLTILSAVSLDQIYSKQADFTTFSGTQYAEWKGRDNEGRLVPSGIYLYALSKGSTLVKGKFAVIR